MQFDDAESPIEVRAQIASIIAVCRIHSDRFIYFVYNLHEAGAPVHNSQQLSCTARTAEINARDYRARQSRIFLIKLIGLIAGALTHVVSVGVRGVGVDVVAHLLHKNTHTDTHCRLEGSGLGEAHRLNINGRYFERIAHYTCAYSTRLGLWRIRMGDSCNKRQSAQAHASLISGRRFAGECVSEIDWGCCFHFISALTSTPRHEWHCQHLVRLIRGDLSVYAIAE